MNVTFLASLLLHRTAALQHTLSKQVPYVTANNSAASQTSFHGLYLYSSQK